MKCQNSICVNELSPQQEKHGGRFCCRACSNSGVPRIVKTKIETRICPGCDKETTNKKYCDNKCQMIAAGKERRQKFLDGHFVGTEMGFPSGSWPRQFLIEQFGYKCNSCRITEWNGSSITLEVNHKDGRSNNNVIENLEFLCPNCHSQTSTYRAKNINNATRTGRNKYRPISLMEEPRLCNPET